MKIDRVAISLIFCIFALAFGGFLFTEGTSREILVMKIVGPAIFLIAILLLFWNALKSDQELREGQLAEVVEIISAGFFSRNKAVLKISDLDTFNQFEIKILLAKLPNGLRTLKWDNLKFVNGQWEDM